MGIYIKLVIYFYLASIQELYSDFLFKLLFPTYVHASTHTNTHNNCKTTISRIIRKYLSKKEITCQKEIGRVIGNNIILQ